MFSVKLLNMIKIKESEELKKQIKELKKKTDEYLAGWKRAKADYLNREREIVKKKDNWVKFANLELILKLLPILDSFDHSLNHIPKDLKDNQWAKGMEQIRQQLRAFLKAEGVEKIKTLGEKFNPERHEVVEKKGEGGKIIEETQAGYLINDKVVRIAKVVIE